MDRGGESERTDRQRDYTCSLPVFPEQGWGALPHLKVNRFFFFLFNLSLLLTGTAISGCYGNSHRPDQPVSGNTRSYTQQSPTHAHYFMSAGR